MNAISKIIASLVIAGSLGAIPLASTPASAHEHGYYGYGCYDGCGYGDYSWYGYDRYDGDRFGRDRDRSDFRGHDGRRFHRG